MNAAIEVCGTEAFPCVCDDPRYKAEIEGLKQITAIINSWYEIPPSPKGYGKLAMEYCEKRLPLRVLETQRGFYIGTMSDEGPCSRESVEYFRSSKLAQEALDNSTWTQRSNP